MRTGQTALIALLVLTIAMTVGLSLVARSTTDTSMTRTLEESARAFSAAEAGVEDALKTGAGVESPLDPQLGTKYTVTVVSVSGNATSPLVFPGKTIAGNTQTIWLASHNTDGSISEVPTYTAPSLSFCWSQEQVLPAVVVTILYKESSDATGNPYRVVKAAYDPDQNRASGATANNFSTPDLTTGGCGADTKTTYKQTITFAALSPAIDPTLDVLIALRIRPVYGPTQIAVLPGQQLPVQGNQITSVGNTVSGVNRKIVVNQAYKSAPTVFDAAIYSEGDFSHVN